MTGQRVGYIQVSTHGRYEFQKQPDPLNVDAIIRELTEIHADPTEIHADPAVALSA